MAEKNKKRRAWPKHVAIGLVVALVLCVAVFGIYASDYYHAGSQAEALVAAGVDAAGAPIADSGSAIAVGDPASEYGVVLYPGAKVAPEAYVPLATKLADQGAYCVVVKMPFNFAFFGINAADAAMANAPQVRHWWLAGHSLGGAMGAQYAAGNASKLEGIALLGAYAASDLSDTDLKALVIYGQNDGVLNRDKLASCAGNLPDGAQTLVIEGGNHAGYADYGPQDGDGAATITADQQQEQVAGAIAAAMRE